MNSTRHNDSKQKSGPNYGALLATNGFVQNHKKSTGFFTFWECEGASAITSSNGFCVYVGDTAYGGSTEEHLRGYLATFTTLKQTLAQGTAEESSDVDTVYLISLPMAPFASIAEQATCLLECASAGAGSTEYHFSNESTRDEALRKVRAHILQLLDECKADIVGGGQ